MYLLLMFYGIVLPESTQLLKIEVKDIRTSSLMIKFVDETRFLSLGFNISSEKWELMMYKIEKGNINLLDKKVITKKNQTSYSNRMHSGMCLSRNKDKVIVFGMNDMAATIYLVKKEKLFEDTVIDIIGDREPRFVLLTEDANKIIIIFRTHEENGFVTKIRVNDIMKKKYVDTDILDNKMRFGDCLYKSDNLIMTTAIGIYVWKFNEENKAILKRKYKFWSYDWEGIWSIFDDALKIHLLGDDYVYCCYRNFFNQLVCCKFGLGNISKLNTKTIGFMLLPNFSGCTGFYDFNSDILVKIDTLANDSLLEVRRSGTTVLSKKIEGSLIGYDINENYIAFCTMSSKNIFVIVK